MAKTIKIPKLPYGQGSMSLRADGMVMYRKRIGNPKKEYTVYAETPKEAMEKMQEKEKQLEQKKFIAETKTIIEAMTEWADTYKKAELKKTSYGALKKTIEHQIDGYDVAHIRVDSITSDKLQKHLNELNSKKNYSYSTIKKVYDAFNDFFRFAHMNNKIETNPMLLVKMINKENIVKETKEISFFEKDDIKKFTEEATRLFIRKRKPRYQYGFCLAANIYLGMRGGELIALKWKDVDFQNDTIWVHENLQMIENPEYDKNNKEEMKRLEINKYIFELQSLKNYQNRHIHMNQKAKDLLLHHKVYSDYNKPDDYVCSTMFGGHATIGYLSDNIAQIEKASEMKVQEKGTHIIRHTCASLYFRAGVRIELIASLLGHSVEVCRKTYIHFVEEQEKEAVRLINDYDCIDV